tara:strand:+ start:721 stop:1077 length:357 start_codon:yes stop_codon:yes gene_type:complete
MININSITKEDGKIYVSVSLKPYCHRLFRNHVSCDTAALELLLKERKVAHGKCLQEKHLLNRREKTCSGTWIFEDIQKATQQSRKKNTQSRRSKKNEKTLDKSSEDVIIDSRDKTFEE